MAGQASVAGIVLAAGFSRRLGRPKQTVMLAGETLVERAAHVAHGAGLSPVIVVVNSQILEVPEFNRIALEALGCIVVSNPGAAEGMAASIRCGVDQMQGASVQGAILMTCDQVAVTSSHLRELFGEPEEIAASGYAGRVGVPAYFPQRFLVELEVLRGDQGARELLRTARIVPAEELALDVDSDDDLRRAEEWLREQESRTATQASAGTLPAD